MRRIMVGTGILVVLLVVAVSGFFLWRWRTDAAYSACTIVHIARQPPFVLYPVVTNKEDFDNFRRNQIALVKSRFVLNRALKNPKVAALTTVNQRTDSIAWLEMNLIVDSPEDTPSLLRISLKGDDPDELVLIVNAVRDAYLNDFVYKEQRTREARLQTLRRLFEEYNRKLMEKSLLLAKLEQNLGSQNKPPVGIELAKELVKELPRLRLAQTAVQVRLNKAEGKQAEDLKVDLAVLDSQEKMINDYTKVVNERNDAKSLEEEIHQAQSVCQRIRGELTALEIEGYSPMRISLLQDAVATKNQ